ncbi:protein BTR1 [Lolium perenne]|uniref:protein BTR1 n=1 Tax=Lolium perenne TaxID=4522 RepID=UPI0021EAC47B|nr:protein BTR1-like [Lolium perenne]
MASSPPASDDDRYEDDLWEQRTHARILVSDSEAGGIIGRGGSAVTALKSTSGALVKVSRRGQLLPGTGRRVLLVSGLFHQVMDAAEIILQKILYQGGQVIDERATVVLVVPDACCGVLIGKGGTNIKSLAEASNAGIVISRHDKHYGLQDRLVTITGNLDNQLQAIFLILSELLEDDRYSRIYAGALFLGCEDYGPDEHVERYHSRSNTPIRSPDNNDDACESLTIAIADEHIGAVIGCGGRKIREIIQFTGAWIRTSAKGEFIAGTTDREVVISGTREAINTAEGMIMHVVSAARSRSNGSAERPPLKPDTTPQQEEQSNTSDLQ